MNKEMGADTSDMTFNEEDSIASEGVNNNRLGKKLPKQQQHGYRYDEPIKLSDRDFSNDRNQPQPSKNPTKVIDIIKESPKPTQKKSMATQDSGSQYDEPPRESPRK